jgi:hypothetical protein
MKINIKMAITAATLLLAMGTAHAEMQLTDAANVSELALLSGFALIALVFGFCAGATDWFCAAWAAFGRRKRNKELS